MSLVPLWVSLISATKASPLSSYDARQKGRLRMTWSTNLVPSLMAWGEGRRRGHAVGWLQER